MRFKTGLVATLLISCLAFLYGATSYNTEQISVTTVVVRRIEKEMDKVSQMLTLLIRIDERVKSIDERVKKLEEKGDK